MPLHAIGRNAWASWNGSQAAARSMSAATRAGSLFISLRLCRRVTGIDVSRASLEVAERNLQANRSQISAEVDWIEADAFEILRDWSQAGEQFDAIVLDPPAFANGNAPLRAPCAVTRS